MNIVKDFGFTRISNFPFKKRTVIRKLNAQWCGKHPLINSYKIKRFRHYILITDNIIVFPNNDKLEKYILDNLFPKKEKLIVELI